MEVESTFEENDPGSDGEVWCFREGGEMVQCEVCVGLFPFGVSKDERRSWCAGW